MQLRDGAATKIVLGLGLFSLLCAVIAAQEAMKPTPTASLPDFPNLRKREALEPGFTATLLQLAQDLDPGASVSGGGFANGIPFGDKLAALMDEESGFDPQAGNPDGGATGLIQWMPFMAVPFTGLTVDQLREMSAIDQLGAVRSTIARDAAYRVDPAIAGAGKPVTLGDDAVLWTSDQGAYKQNSGYDRDGKGYITAGDIRHVVYDRLARVGRIQVVDGQVV